MADWKTGQRKRITRRRACMGAVFEWSWILRAVFFLSGSLWLLLLPTGVFNRTVWIDENALSPNSVKAHWDWANVRQADYYLETMEAMRDRGSPHSEFISFVLHEFQVLGLDTDTQTYTINTRTESGSGVNVYASLSAPRTTGSEAVVISASWRSLSYEDGSDVRRNGNLRAIAMVIAMAKQYKGLSLWARDIIFVISDGYLDGMHAFLSTYHGVKTDAVVAEPLRYVNGGVIWVALCLDYPGHSFSELGIFYEGTNGRLPNQDLLNSINVISKHTGNVPVVLYDGGDDILRARIDGWLPACLRKREVVEYLVRASHILRHVGYQASGRPSGVHGLFHQYRIDAVTLFAVPAQGPHGFFALGKVMESSMRTVNNLLERLHASFFFYLLTSGPDEFIVIGQYLTAAVLIGIGLELNGLYSWVASGWRKAGPAGWERKKRPLVLSLGVMIATHLIGLALAVVLNSAVFVEALESWLHPVIVATVAWALPFLVVQSLGLRAHKSPSSSSDPLSDRKRFATLLNSFTLCIAGTVVCITSVLNFSLAAVLAIAFSLALPVPRATSIPLGARSSGLGHISRIARHSITFLAAPTSLAWLASVYVGPDSVVRSVKQSIWEWNVLQVWTLPFACCVYFPLILQASIAALVS